MTGADINVQGKRKTKVGRVVSDKMDKTIAWHATDCTSG